MTDTRHLKKVRLRLALFLALSTTMHASLLLDSHSPAREFEAGQDRDVLSVNLDAVATTVLERPRPPHAADATIPGSDDSGRMPTLVESRSLPATNHDGDDAYTANVVRAQVVSELARHFRYPPLARLRGWEGRVLLGFRVESDGQLHQQRVLNTSGFVVLDQAALDSLRRVARVADAGDTRLDLQISVLYRLTDTY